jgi:hypothetical protein
MTRFGSHFFFKRGSSLEMHSVAEDALNPVKPCSLVGFLRNSSLYDPIIAVRA